MHFWGRRGGGGDTVQGVVRAGGRVWVGARSGYTDFGSGIYRNGRGRGDDGFAAGGGHHVRGFSDADDGSVGEPGGEGSLHVGRNVEGADGAADDAGGNAAVGGTALAIAARVALPCAGAEGGDAVDALRREGIAEDRDSR